MGDAVKKQGLFSRIETREDALKLVRDGSIAFLVLAGLEALIGVFLAPAMLLDAAIVAVLALIIWKAQSRVGAVALLLVTGAEAVITVLNRIGATSSGGSNVFLAVLMLILSIRLVEATFRLARPQPPARRAPAMSGSGARSSAR